MAIPDWPPALNYYLEQGSFKMVPHDPMLRSDFEYGPARQRQRFTKIVPKISGTIILDGGAVEAFKSFYHETLLDGTRWFNMPVYQGTTYGTAMTRFTRPYEMGDDGFQTVAVEIEVEIRGLVVLDEGAAYFIGVYGEDLLWYMDDTLQYIVNELYPQTMEDY